MLGHILFIYKDKDGNIIFKESDRIFENSAGQEMVQPVLDFVKNNTKAQMLQKAKASGYKAYTKENYNELYPLKDDLYMMIDLIKNRVDFYAKHKPLFENEDVFELPESVLNVLRKIGSYPMKEGGKGFKAGASIKKDFEQVLGEMDYIRWINHANRRHNISYYGRSEIYLDEPYNRLPKITKEILERNGYKFQKEHYRDRWVAFKDIEGDESERLTEEEREALEEKEYRALRIDRTYHEVEKYLENMDIEKIIEWSNRTFLETGKSILNSVNGIYLNKPDGGYSLSQDYYGYIVHRDKLDEIYDGLPLKVVNTLSAEYSPSLKGDEYYILVDGYIMKIQNTNYAGKIRLNDDKIRLIIENAKELNDPKLEKLANDYLVMQDFKQSHLYYAY